MQSAGHGRDNMTYPVANSLSSGSISARVRRNQTTVSTPTHTTASPTGYNSHRLPPLTDLRQSLMDFPPAFQSPQQPFVQAIRRNYSGGSSGLPQGYPEPSPRSILPSMAYDRNTVGATSSDCLSHTAECPPVLRRLGPMFPSPVDPDRDGNYYRPDHLSRIGANIYATTTTVTRPVHSLSTSFPVAHSFQLHAENPAVNYERGYTAVSHNTSYPSSSCTSYHQEGFRESTSLPSLSFSSAAASFHSSHSDPSLEACPPHPAPTTLSFNAPTTSNSLIGAVDEPAVDLNIGNQSSASTTITATLHMNVSVTTNQEMVMDTTRIRPSSIPMSNGNPPLSVIPPSTPGPSASWSQYPQQPPSTHSTRASMSISASGNASVKLKAHVTYSPPAPSNLQSAPGASRNYQISDSQLSPIQQIPTDTDTKLSKKSPSLTIGNHNMGASNNIAEGETDPQAPPLKKRKKGRMHECAVCGKEFPRPSGLLTHMNTHNNAKPYACTYPGCKRRFGVRSNAKRHLRTHGIPANPPPNPTHSDPPRATTSTKPSTSAKPSIPITNKATHPQSYVIDFEPVILGEPVPVVATKGKAAVRGTRTGLKASSETGGVDGIVATPNGASASSSRPGPPFFKLRWMPLSSTSRTNTNTLKNISQKGSQEDGSKNEGARKK